MISLVLVRFIGYIGRTGVYMGIMNLSIPYSSEIDENLLSLICVGIKQ
ncbi:hypothetical protein [Candidatus Erwinia haradaeae]|nr:hypothetical protein [Candidatus Erwinia haradaeae]